MIRPLLALTLCSACAVTAPTAPPKPSDLVLSPATVPEVARVSVPMPAPVMAPTPTGSARASLFTARQESLFSDQRADDVGDIVTVIIRIDDEARLRTNSEREREGSASVGFPTFFGLGTAVADALETLGLRELPQDGPMVNIAAEAESGGSGSIARNEEVNLKVAALVVQKLPNGNLVVAGRQEIMVSNELRELRMAGIVRPSDIRNDNTIPYERIAEARVSYGGRGALSRTQAVGYGERAVDVILPY